MLPIFLSAGGDSVAAQVSALTLTVTEQQKEIDGLKEKLTAALSRLEALESKPTGKWDILFRSFPGIFPSRLEER